MISPASLLHTPLTTPPSKHFCSWLSCSAEARFRFFWGEKMNRPSTGGTTLPNILCLFSPPPGHSCPMALDIHTFIPAKDAAWSGWGKQDSLYLPARDKDVCRSCRPVLSLSACASGCTPGLCWAVRKIVPTTWGRCLGWRRKSHHNLGGLQLG